MVRIEPLAKPISPELLELYRSIQPSTIGHLTDFGYIRGLQPLVTPIRLLGTALTVRLPHIGSAALHEALELARPGDVIVIDMSGDEDRACWGEFRAYKAIAKGVAGAVVSGCVSDAAVLRQLRFPVFSRGVSALTTRSLELEGEVNTCISVGGVAVRPGDLIIGDEDGLFAIDPKRAEELGRLALEKQEREQRSRVKLGYGHIGGHINEGGEVT
ncbi:RraA family protein [Paenibacillus campinasensis]|uniref:Putative 4-hydroxy-4-methyl-2-oxoglutarate aldolase n=1 Tax=Paenibacillus campinasensis TaxID=66347 RepID=A0A268EV88_9BACL|nr:S-adenosylmethionine--2-demethylmenaquinone methyltransferase [Paenibacillus campinasensis]PAD77038.1 S-adenosylmethionine--2-demethylmenaquinone methyltransferase [Paenibacillus campinasensis]